MWVCSPRNIPMVTGPADNRGCIASQLQQRKMGRKRVWNLRNTARGASSPAKPALHMPELVRRSVNYSEGMPLKSMPSSRKMNAPIVNDESCDLLCTTTIESAVVLSKYLIVHVAARVNLCQTDPWGSIIALVRLPSILSAGEAERRVRCLWSELRRGYGESCDGRETADDGKSRNWIETLRQRRTESVRQGGRRSVECVMRRALSGSCAFHCPFGGRRARLFWDGGKVVPAGI